MAGINYEKAYNQLVAKIQERAKITAKWAQEWWQDSYENKRDGDEEAAHTSACLATKYEGQRALCEELLGNEKLDANGMVSLHLYKWYDRTTCMLDLSCPEGEQPERVYHEVMQTIGGLHDSGVTVSVDKHMYEVRYNGEFGVTLDKVRVASDWYVWVNDEGQEVDGPDVIFCYYYDTALIARPVA